MARKTAEITLPAGDDRDAGKTFVLTEMSAMAAERWAIRAFLALARSGIDVPDEIAEMGMAGVAQMGLRAFAGVNFDDAEPLMAEMMRCVSIKEPLAVRALTADDVEEVGTLLLLKAEVFKLHVDFSKLAALSERMRARQAARVGESS